MQVLFYLNPEADFRAANKLSQWAAWLLRIHYGLLRTLDDYHGVFVGHESAATYFKRDGERFVGVPSNVIPNLVRARNNYAIGGFGAEDYLALEQILGRGLEPDAIVAIGDASFLQCTFPRARILHVEMSPFYRLLDLGLRFCVTFTGHSKLSDIAQYLDSVVTLEMDGPSREALSTIRSAINAKFRSEPTRKALDSLRGCYRKICVVPLAESWFSPLRVPVDEIVQQLLAASDPQELFILADHPLAQALSATQVEKLQCVYPNAMVARDTFPGLSTQHFFPHCDVVYSDFSHSALDSLFFEDVQYRSALMSRPDLQAYADYRNSLSSHLSRLAPDERDLVLYALLKYYFITPDQFFNAEWWSNLLSPCQAPISFEHIQALLE